MNNVSDKLTPEQLGEGFAKIQPEDPSDGPIELDDMHGHVAITQILEGEMNTVVCSPREAAELIEQLQRWIGTHKGALN